jgi:hypothetical protein
MANNGDTNLKVTIGNEKVVGIGSFHKTLPHNQYGEVEESAFKKLVKATKGDAEFGDVPEGGFQPPASRTAALINPQAGLAKDRLTEEPSEYEMLPAPKVVSETTAAEMTELYWMALLRDVSFDKFDTDAKIQQAAQEINQKFGAVTGNPGNGSKLQTGVDVPGKAGMLNPITPQNIFRLGLPGEETGPLVSQFFIRRINYGTQIIDQQQRPYKKAMNYLTKFEDWLCAQDSGNNRQDGLSYNLSNEAKASYYEGEAKTRYISTPRDLARFVNKDALHQAYFNAALLMLSGGARWTRGNPYGDGGRLERREAGFGTLGGPHILALVSEVATRALKIVWYQKWQVHLRLRPEAYGGLVHMQNIGLGGVKRPYGLPDWVATTEAATEIRKLNNDNGEETLLLPMAFTAGSPIHPAYGAGHASVAGICVTVLKAFFKTFDDNGDAVKLNTLTERPNPYLPPAPFKTYITGVDANGNGHRTEITEPNMTIEGELNKLAMNVAMGRTMGGVHWRTDNARSLMLGEAVAAQILADITKDLAEKPKFEFRTFSRKADGNPKMVAIENGKIKVDGVKIDSDPSIL